MPDQSGADPFYLIIVDRKIPSAVRQQTKFSHETNETIK